MTPEEIREERDQLREECARYEALYAQEQNARAAELAAENSRLVLELAEARRAGVEAALRWAWVDWWGQPEVTKDGQELRGWVAEGLRAVCGEEKG